MHDFVVVGAGSAGCVLAARLSEDPSVRVLLLEAGPEASRRDITIPAAFSRNFRTAVDWDYTTEPQAGAAGRSLYWPRGRVVGGSSSINAMMYVRGHPADFDGWAEGGCEGWSWDDVLPWFRHSEDHAGGASEHHGAGGPMAVRRLRSPHPLSRAFVEAAVSLGIPRNDDVNGPDQVGAGLTWVTQRRGARESSATAFLEPARGRPNLEVRTGCRALRIAVEDGRAVGVETAGPAGRQVVRARREVVLACGAVGSPHLLLLSGVGPGDALRSLGIEVRRHAPEVGEGLADHPATGVVRRSTRRTTLASAGSPADVARWLLFRSGRLTSNVAEALAFLPPPEGAPAPVLELLFGPVIFVDHGLEAPRHHGFTLGPVLLRPESRGRLTLRSPDPEHPPAIDPDYLGDPGGVDVARLVHGLRVARRVAEAEAFDPWRGPEIMPGPGVPDEDGALEAYVRATVETLYHPVGTCRMGSDDASVVDTELRVRGVEGLRVVDASVMPTLVRGHTHAATVMIAERGASFLLGRGPAPPGAGPPPAGPLPAGGGA